MNATTLFSIPSVSGFKAFCVKFAPDVPPGAYYFVMAVLIWNIWINYQKLCDFVSRIFSSVRSAVSSFKGSLRNNGNLVLFLLAPFFIWNGACLEFLRSLPAYVGQVGTTLLLSVASALLALSIGAFMLQRSIAGIGKTARKQAKRSIGDIFTDAKKSVASHFSLAKIILTFIGGTAFAFAAYRVAKIIRERLQRKKHDETDPSLESAEQPRTDSTKYAVETIVNVTILCLTGIGTVLGVSNLFTYARNLAFINGIVSKVWVSKPKDDSKKLTDKLDEVFTAYTDEIFSWSLWTQHTGVNSLRPLAKLEHAVPSKKKLLKLAYKKYKDEKKKKATSSSGDEPQIIEFTKFCENARVNYDDEEMVCDLPFTEDGDFDFVTYVAKRLSETLSITRQNRDTEKVKREFKNIVLDSLIRAHTTTYVRHKTNSYYVLNQGEENTTLVSAFSQVIDDFSVGDIDTVTFAQRFIEIGKALKYPALVAVTAACAVVFAYKVRRYLADMGSGTDPAPDVIYELASTPSTQETYDAPGIGGDGGRRRVKHSAADPTAKFYGALAAEKVHQRAFGTQQRYDESSTLRDEAGVSLYEGISNAVTVGSIAKSFGPVFNTLLMQLFTNNESAQDDKSLTMESIPYMKQILPNYQESDFSGSRLESMIASSPETPEILPPVFHLVSIGVEPTKRGTAFLATVNSRRVMITALHCLGGKKECTIYIKDATVHATLIASAGDAAVLHVPPGLVQDITPWTFAATSSLAGLAVACKKLNSRSSGFVTGTPLDNGDGTTRLQHTCSTAPGDSGSPILLATIASSGKVVGIHTSSVKEGFTNGFLPWHTVADSLSFQVEKHYERKPAHVPSPQPHTKNELVAVARQPSGAPAESINRKKKITQPAAASKSESKDQDFRDSQGDAASSSSDSGRPDAPSGFSSSN